MCVKPKKLERRPREGENGAMKVGKTKDTRDVKVEKRTEGNDRSGFRRMEERRKENLLKHCLKMT